MSLAQKAFSGVIWTAIERFGIQLIQFAVVVVLARLLSPADFGLVALLMVVFAISGILVNGGFTAALIREQELTEEDKATAFWLNISAALLLYGVIWVLAPAIAAFFGNSELLGLTRFMALSLVFRAFGLVQQAELTHRLAFRKLGFKSIVASSITAAIAISAAVLGAGAWALAIKFVVAAASDTVILWLINPWRPNSWIERKSFEKLFGFGWKLAVSGLINEIFQNVYKVVIGKAFSPAVLGHYTQAHSFQSIASTSIVNVIQKVSYPILAKANSDPARLKRGYRMMIRISSYFVFPTMIGIALVAEPLVLSLVGEKWRATVPMLQILCVSGALYHLHSINLNVLQVMGRSDLFLRLEIIKKINITIAILIGLPFGIWGLLTAQVASSYIALFINMWYTRKFIDYSIGEQLRDVLEIILYSVPMVIVVTLVGISTVEMITGRLALMIIAGIISYALIGLVVGAEPIRVVGNVLGPRIPVVRKTIDRLQRGLRSA